MRAVVTVEEISNRTCLVVSELPYQVNPDNLAENIANLVRDGRLTGIADVQDHTSGRTGQRLVIILRRDAVAKVVLNNLYKHTQLQQNFGANMLALVDGVPRTLPIHAFLKHWITHQLDVIVRRTRFRLRKAEERAHILRALLKALDAMDEVIALIRASATVEVARDGLMELLDIDEIQARAILEMQLRRLAALERQRIIDEYDELMRLIEDYNDILARPERQRQIVGDELAEIVERYGDDRKTQILPFEGDMTAEDLIPVEDVVVTVTRGGYAKRTRTDLYRAQRRGGRGVRVASLREDDVVEHFFTTTTHHWLLFFTNLGRVYRAKGYELPEGGRDGRGQHVANLPGVPAGRADRRGPRHRGLRAGGLPRARHPRRHRQEDAAVGVRLEPLRRSHRHQPAVPPGPDGGEEVDDELFGATLVDEGEDLFLVSRKGMSVRFEATDENLRPMGRATSGVTGMKFRGDDELLAMAVARDDLFVFVVTELGYAKRTKIGEYRKQGRGGLGIKVAKLTEERGDLVGALTVSEEDEVLVVMQAGRVVRSRVDEVPAKGRDTMGVTFARPETGDRILAVARNAERVIDEEVEAEEVSDATTEAADDPLLDTAGAGDDQAAAEVPTRPERWSTCGGTGERPCGGGGRWRTVVRGSAERARHRR